MPCEFVNETCPMPGNFICRRCKNCSHAISIPAGTPEDTIQLAINSIKANCEHAKNSATVVDGVVLPPEPSALPAPPAPQAAIQDPTAGLPDPLTGAPVNNTPAVEGPGAYLKKYLSKIGITSTPTCSCNAKARHMDTMGVEWCEENLDTIVGWLKEEAEKRSLPFFDWPARMLVKKAISSAKRARAAIVKTADATEQA